MNLADNFITYEKNENGEVPITGLMGCGLLDHRWPIMPNSGSIDGIETIGESEPWKQSRKSERAGDDCTDSIPWKASRIGLVADFS